MTYNYEQEIENMKSGKNGSTFKPKTGQYNILFMSEPEATEFEDKDTHEKTPQVKMEIRVDGGNESQIWYIGKSKTIQGIYMQLMMLGKEKKELKGQSITLLVKQTTDKDGKKKNEYTVVEALPLIKKFQETQTLTEKVN
jgi:hypothetical protein